MWSFFRCALVLPVAAVAGLPLMERVQSQSQHDHLPRAQQAWEAREPMEIFADGYVEGRHREVPMQFEVAGRIASIHVEEGEIVTQGQVIAELDDVELSVELEMAQAGLERAIAQRGRLLAGSREEERATARAEARVQYEAVLDAKTHLERVYRARQSDHPGVVTGQELDERKAAYAKSRASYAAALARVKEVEAAAREEDIKIADAEIEMAEAKVAFVEARLQKTKLRAPFDGLVLRRLDEPGEIVNPESNEPILVIVDNSEIRVRAYVEELQAMSIDAGSRVFVEADGLAGVRLAGEVVRCAPGMVPKSHFSDRPDERQDVSVREVVLRLDEGPEASQLVVGLPVDVYIQATAPEEEGLAAGL